MNTNNYDAVRIENIVAYLIKQHPNYVSITCNAFLESSDFVTYVTIRYMDANYNYPYITHENMWALGVHRSGSLSDYREHISLMFDIALASYFNSKKGGEKRCELSD